MFIKCLLLLFILSFIDAQYHSFRRPYTRRPCRLVTLKNGRGRLRARQTLIRFTCDYHYELVGNQYGTCLNGQWDTEIPVCVRPGCEPLPEIQNGAKLETHKGAWVTVFCYPGLKRIGPPVIFCDGYHWNGTIPSCVDTNASVKYSCDFEDSDLCGWGQDELHDFDWIRLNRKTPSSFLMTGPTYDHTYGANGTGYYMYIESTSRLENDTARLISPIYDVSSEQDSCFQFFYHMFGKRTGGLRVYQKPESLQMATLLGFNSVDKQKYLLFELWGNQGDMWYQAIPQLRNFSERFQIIIEALRGKGFTSDIAIDDVAILHGENCTEARYTTAPPPSTSVDSCSGRCGTYGNFEQNNCGCIPTCIDDHDCCLDFLDLCEFSKNNSTDDDSSTTEIMTTAKLTAASSNIFNTRTTTTTSTSTITPNSEKAFIPTTTTTTLKPTTVSKPTTLKPTTVPKPTTLKLTTVPKPTTTPKTTTTFKPTPAFTPTSTVKISTTSLKTTSATLKTTISEPKTTQSKTIGTTGNSKITTQMSNEVKKENNKINANKQIAQSHVGSTAGAIVGVICVIVLILGILWRVGKGRSTLARIRGRVSNDPEVRYLNSTIND